MPAIMAKKKRPKRTGVNLNVYVQGNIVTALQGYLASTQPRVSKTAAVEAALIQFLKAQGHWPPAQPSGEDEGGV
jgi:hypothetical protein